MCKCPALGESLSGVVDGMRGSWIFSLSHNLIAFACQLLPSSTPLHYSETNSGFMKMRHTNHRPNRVLAPLFAYLLPSEMWSYFPDRTDTPVHRLTRVHNHPQNYATYIQIQNKTGRQNNGWKQCMLLTRKHDQPRCAVWRSQVAHPFHPWRWTCTRLNQQSAATWHSPPVFVLATILSRLTYLHIHIIINTVRCRCITSLRRDHPSRCTIRPSCYHRPTRTMPVSPSFS
jgi:hypothetical protein